MNALTLANSVSRPKNHILVGTLKSHTSSYPQPTKQW